MNAHDEANALVPTKALVVIPPEPSPPRRGIGAISAGAAAVGALALGALAIGAVAILRLSIGRMAVRHSHLGKVRIDELVVRKLTVLDQHTH